ncbi:MAG: DNA-methyltransferase [Candidatus Kariarchaeaceae archaeon]
MNEFIPTFDWSVKQAAELYHCADNDNNNLIQFIDCLEGFKNIEDSSIDLVIADPPFGIGFTGKANDQRFYNRDDSKVIEGYKEVAPEEYFSFSAAWIAEVYRVLKETGSAWITSGWTNLRHVENAIAQTGFFTINHLVWHYAFSPRTSRKFSSSHYDLLFVCKNDRKRFFNLIENYPLDVWIINRVWSPGIEKNGTKLPIELVQKMIDFTSKPGDIILDPFMGNGTTAQAAKGSFRHYLGFEINTKAQKLIENNIKKVTLGDFYTPYYNRVNGDPKQTSLLDFCEKEEST